MSSPNRPRPLGSPASPVRNIAHRGARAFAPENTLAAFAKAHSLGASMIELDVHLSRDGEPVVHHDDDLLRCTDVKQQFPGRSSYFVSDFDCDDLVRLDAGTWYVRELVLPLADRQPFLQSLTADEADAWISSADRDLYRSGTIHIPRLRDVLDLAQQLGLLVNIELKTLPRLYPGLADTVVRLVEARHLEEQVLLSSFDHEQLLIVRQRSSVIATAVLTCDRLARPGDYLSLLDADAYHPGCYGPFDSLGFGSVDGVLDPCGIAHVRATGRGVNVWTCNDPAHMRQLLAAGVSGLISDYPNRVRDVLSAIPGPAGVSGGDSRIRSHPGSR